MGPRRLLYLSGAPRVTTHPSCAEPGPRSHILGVISGFRDSGWTVSNLIVGDILRTGRGATDGGRRKSLPRLLINDLLRLASGAVFGPLALVRSGGATLCYERLGLMQALGGWSRLRGIPWVLETQSICTQEAQTTRRATVLGGLAAAIERSAYRRCDLVVAVSEVVRDDVCRFAAIPAEKVLVLPNGVDCDAIRPAERTSDANGPLRIGFVGTVLAWQNLPALIAVVAELRAEGLDLIVSIAGDGGGLPECREQVRRLGLETVVRFAGRIPHAEVGQFLAGVDLGYSGQRPDGSATMYHSPLKLYEYMAAGIPFVASRYPDAVRASAGSCDEFLFDPSVPGSLARCLRQAWRLRHTLIQRGADLRRTVVREHGWKRRVSVLLDALVSRKLVRG